MLASRRWVLLLTLLGCASPAQLAPSSPVTGTWIDTFVNARTSGMQKVDLSGAEVTAWAWDAAQAKWRRFAGTGTDQGRFEVPEVPGGAFVLGVRRSTSSTPLFFESEAGSRGLDLGRDGYDAPAGPDAGPGTGIDLSVSGLDPPQKADALPLICDNGVQWLQVGSIPGATSKRLQIDWKGLPLIAGGQECLLQ